LDFDIGVTGFSIPEIDSLIDGLAPKEPGNPAEHGVRPVLVLGFDTYGGQPYEWEWIQPYIEAIYGGRYRHYFNAVGGGARRGILYVVPEG
jgi:hypothetical protein